MFYLGSVGSIDFDRLTEDAQVANFVQGVCIFLFLTGIYFFLSFLPVYSGCELVRGALQHEDRTHDPAARLPGSQP